MTTNSEDRINLNVSYHSNDGTNTCFIERGWLKADKLNSCILRAVSIASITDAYILFKIKKSSFVCGVNNL